MKSAITFLISFLFLYSVVAQKPQMKWGKIPKKDLAMTVYEADPEVEAVVLGDIGRITFDISGDDLTYKMMYHKRIKILKKSAFERGDISIPFYTPDKYEEIRGLKAQIILPNGDKVKVKDIFEEKINDYYSAKKFAFPNLTEGCVIEYKYTKISKDYFNLENWYFQEDIPVRISRLSTEIPEWYHYISFTQGRKATKEVNSVSTQVTIPRSGTRHTSVTKHGSVKKHATNDQIDVTLITTDYTMENIPALKVEPYITTMRDYYSKIQFQLKAVQYPNELLREIHNTWEKVETELIKHHSFGNQIEKKRFTKKMWAVLQPVLAKVESTEEKLATIYKFVNSNIVWDETYSFFVEKTLDDAFESKSANSGELNLMFIALCRQAGIASHPILISTRSHGKMLPYYPKVDQFNHVLASVKINNKTRIFDVGSSFRPAVLLRENSLNYTGWLVRENNSEWIPINSPTDREVCMANFELSSDGSLTGSIDEAFNGYVAIRERIACSNDKENKAVKKVWTEKFADIQIDSITIENEKALTKSLKKTFQCTIPDAALISGDFIYISPVIAPYTENPFKLEKREYPIDMSYGFNDQYVLNLTIPEGYVVDELPESINISLPNKGGKFQFFLSQKENTIQLVNKIKVTQLHYEQEEYGIIRNFFDIIVEKHSEQIVLKKAA